jgi:REP element-mobilizing transposase RayT
MRLATLLARPWSRLPKRTGAGVIEMKAIEDHVHLLLALNDLQKLPVVMHDLKGASAREVFKQFQSCAST